MAFRQRLLLRQKDVNSLVCVGLDPLREKMPVNIKKRMWFSHDWKRVAQWMIDIVDTTAPFASMYKLQKAHYEAFRGGNKALRAIIAYIHNFHPNIPVFLDCKRGDIGRTQQCYRIAHFEIDDADGMNFSPYMGSTCMSSLYDSRYPGKAIVGLCYTSNPEAREVQDVKLADGRLYWQFMAEKILCWSREIGVNENAGLVMAAAHMKDGEIFSYHLTSGRKIVGEDLWFLIPGIGTQEGFVKETVQASYAGPGSIVINSSSGIIFASSADDYAIAAAAKAEELCDQIRSAM